MNILFEIAEAGWLVYSLGQDKEGTWLAELWLPEEDGSQTVTGSVWGYISPEDALCAAFALTATAKGKVKYKVQPYQEPSSILSQLGLSKPKAPLVRRI